MLIANQIYHKVLRNVSSTSAFCGNLHDSKVYFFTRNENYQNYLATISLDLLKIQLTALRLSTVEATNKYLSPVFLFCGVAYFLSESEKNGTQIERIGSDIPLTKIPFSCRYVGFLQEYGLLIVESETCNIVSIDIVTGRLSFITGSYKNVLAASCSGMCASISFGGMSDGIIKRDSSIFLGESDAKVCKEYSYSQKICTINAHCASGISIIGTDKTVEVFDNCKFEKVNTLFTETLFMGSGIIDTGFYTLETATTSPWYLKLKVYNAKGNLKYNLSFPHNYLVNRKVHRCGKYSLFTAVTNEKSVILAVDTENKTLQELASMAGAIADIEQYGDLLLILSDTGDGNYILSIFQIS